MQSTYDTDKRKLLSSLCHGSIFLSSLLVSIGIPIAILVVSEDPVVKENAKEAINFHLNVWLYGLILVPLSFITFGLAGGIWWLVHWGLSIWAITHCLRTPETAFRYPFIFRVV
ncbi:DUF4870 domain-containing protein [Oculatella sp. LEGE 06141]|uniref:DUF4870 domain-containing protein n=1 Tax=Oculatella sp. LEGE 06141 TaxID=1828648 RepID=UPI001880C76A|nr:DUF4870 domain-containing protein [Oculatella sp. LEGE 06141]MBE9177618.1 DUF4870 domain-containing protein [Oculatella sp. LEGE 06141]